MTIEQRPAGRLETRLEGNTDSPIAVAIVAPELGQTMLSRVVHHIAHGLVRLNCAVIRFNFSGTGASPGDPNEPLSKIADYRALLDIAAQSFPDTPIWAVGHSFGSAVAMNVGAADPRVTLLLGVGLLVGEFDYDLVVEAEKPTFIIHGEADDRCALQVVRRFYGSLSEPRELIVIDGADHTFDGHASELTEAIEDLLADWQEQDA
jgi:uncharacterized protein